jgi:hypothetical protein
MKEGIVNKLLALAMLTVATQTIAQESEKPAEPATAQPDESSKPDPKSESRPARTLRPDRLDLETTVVTGNRELPRVLYIVPWKKAELGELPAQPFNTLLDEVLQPVDRDVFRREVKYFHAIQSGADKPAATPVAPTAR